MGVGGNDTVTRVVTRVVMMERKYASQLGCYDGAEICELVGIYIQSKLCKLMNKKDFGLYRDDGLGILRNTSGPEADRKRKSIKKGFKECGLCITC